jgi:hypothetical protein
VRSFMMRLKRRRCDVAQLSERCRGISSVKILLEVLLSIVLHPIAVILMWINLFGRTDLNGIQKSIWAITGILWGIGPILYFLVGGGELW